MTQASPPAAAAQSVAPAPAGIATVVRLQGEAAAGKAGSTRSLAPQSMLAADETVTTGDRARLEIRFSDGTGLTLGEKSAVTLDRFVFSPAGGSNLLSVSVVGPFRFVSGALGKAAGSEVAVRTPLATIGVRGTDFWGGPIDGAYGIFLAEGEVTITTGQGTVTLSQPGSGVSLTAADAPPGPVTDWPPDKVDRAVATVSFR